MEHHQLIIFRNILLRAFVIGIVFAILLFVGTFALWTTWAGWVQHLFRIEEKDLGVIVLQFFTHVRIVLLFFFLAPALAVHWTAQKDALAQKS